MNFIQKTESEEWMGKRGVEGKHVHTKVVSSRSPSGCTVKAPELTVPSHGSPILAASS